MLKEPRLVEDKYEVLKMIGKGGMGTVFLAENRSLKTLWAIKEVPLNGDSDMLAEPEILKKLNFHALPRIVQIETGKEYMYIIEDYIEGIPLDQELGRRRKFSEKEVRDYAAQLCDILRYLHTFKGGPIIYRDLKPSNLIISPENQLKLVDFGIARVYKETANSDTTYIGTRGYAAPEQYGGMSQTDERTDIYSLGVTLYHLLTGKSPNEPPYEVKPIRQLDQRYSYGLEHILQKCTRPDPRDRYQSIDTLIRDLKNINRFDRNLKRQLVKRDLKVLTVIALLLAFGTLTYLGWGKMGLEKVDKYNGIVKQGEDFASGRNYTEAEKKFKEAISFFPDKIEAYREYALMKLAKRDYTGCIEFVKGSIPDIDAEISEYAKLNYIMGTALFEKAKEENEDRQLYMDAATSFRNALIGDGGNVDYRRDLSASLACAGNVDEAEDELNKIDAGKNEASVLYARAQIQSIKGQYGEAAKNFEESIRRTDDGQMRMNAYISCGRAYQKAGEYGKAISILEEARNNAESMDDPSILAPLAYSYFNRGAKTGNKRDFEKALSLYDTVIKLNYSKKNALESEVNILRRLKRYNDAGLKAREWDKQYPEDYRCYAQLSFIEIERETEKTTGRDYTKAYEYYGKSKKLKGSIRDIVVFDRLESKINELIQKGWIKA